MSCEYAVHGLVVLDDNNNDGLWNSSTVLLTVRQRSSSNLLASYAIGGLPCEIARAATDQRLPLHSIRAILLSPNQPILDGLPAVLLSQNQAGVEKIAVCCGGGGNDDPSNNVTKAVEQLTELILPSRQTHPLVRLCQLPQPKLWYEVYQDDYVTIHGQQIAGGQEDVLLWLLTCHKVGLSFAVIMFAESPGTDGRNSVETLLEPLPVKVVENDARGSTPLLFVLGDANAASMMRTSSHLYQEFITIDSGSTRDNVPDPNLFVRAVDQAKVLQRTIPFAISFPVYNDDDDGKKSKRSSLSTFSTLRLPQLSIDYARRDWIRSESTESTRTNDNKGEIASKSEDLRRAWNSATLAAAADENEIDLDDDDDDFSVDLEETDKALRCDVPHLLVLGTGSATPSPRRGSSAYALLLPSSSALECRMILECGDGVLTSLRRHMPALGSSYLLEIRLVWISHSHLDHYGGLPSLVRAIHKARLEQQRREGKANKACKRMRREFSVLVIAPAKVLRFLSIALVTTRQDYDWFRGVTHQEFRHRRELQEFLDHHINIVELCNIPVHHCRDAHGLLMRIEAPGRSCLVFCYSGDTRPCARLVEDCQKVLQLGGGSRGGGGGGVSLLLHEATFDDNDEGMKEALKKRHSTRAEAVSVARRVGAQACLLTHFSQRYPKQPPSYPVENDHTPVVGFAFDGLLLPLTTEALQSLPKLSDMVHQIYCGSDAA